MFSRRLQKLDFYYDILEKLAKLIRYLIIDNNATYNYKVQTLKNIFVKFN